MIGSRGMFCRGGLYKPKPLVVVGATRAACARSAAVRSSRSPLAGNPRALWKLRIAWRVSASYCPVTAKRDQVQATEPLLHRGDIDVARARRRRPVADTAR